MATATATNMVEAKPRVGADKNAARRLRASGLIPAVLYGAGKEPRAISVDPKIMTRILNSESGHNTIFDVTLDERKVEGDDRRLAIRPDQGQLAPRRPEADRHG